MALGVVVTPASAAALMACFLLIWDLVPPEMGTAVILDASQNIYSFFFFLFLNFHFKKT